MSKLKLRFIQLSDLHLLGNAEDSLFGKNPLESLKEIIHKIKTLSTQPDFLLLSGDMTHKGEENAYYLLEELLKPSGIPYYWLEGNHDNKAIMQKLEATLSVNPNRSFEHQGVYFILLDSVSEDKPHGEFSEETLKFLAKELEKSKSMPCVIAFHHHILPTNCPWIDRSMLQNTTTFFDIATAYSHIEVVLHGHIHNSLLQKEQGLSILSAPSTAFQFDLTTTSFEKPDKVPNGFRIIDIDEDNNFETRVERLSVK